MQTFLYEIEYYITSTGKKPFREWLESLRDINGKARIRIRLDRARLGNLGDHKALDEGVWEMRLDHGPGYRIYFGKDGDRLILLLTGGKKGTQTKDIRTAIAYWMDYQKRRENETDRISERSD